MSTSKVQVAVALGDGIGPSIMSATLRVLEAAGAAIEPVFIEIGEKVYLSGNKQGIAPEAWDVLRRTKVFLKAPITTPQGGGYKSLNVSARKALGLYANVRPCQAYAPYVPTLHPKMDVIIVRENEEDLYAGIEHQQTDDVVQCLKIVIRQGCERIVRYAFELARTQGRQRVTCFVKDNIMKLTDGLFHQVFKEIAAEYPEIQSDSMIVDIGAARLADTPEAFDVIVMPNLYGDILSDVAAQIAGSVGMAGSSNIGDHCAMFEAIHGSAPDLAGRDVANPSGLLNGAVLMLEHLGQNEVAARIRNAWLRTLEDGLHTADIYQEGVSAQKVGTEAFAQAVIDRLGQQPAKLPASMVQRRSPMQLWTPKPRRKALRQLVGVDVFLEGEHQPEALGALLQGLQLHGLRLQVITNRGVKVFPGGLPETFCVNHWRCRFTATEGSISFEEVLHLQGRMNVSGLEVIKTENLYTFDGEPRFAGVHG